MPLPDLSFFRNLTSFNREEAKSLFDRLFSSCGNCVGKGCKQAAKFTKYGNFRGKLGRRGRRLFEADQRETRPPAVILDDIVDELQVSETECVVGNRLAFIEDLLCLVPPRAVGGASMEYQDISLTRGDAEAAMDLTVDALREELGKKVEGGGDWRGHCAADILKRIQQQGPLEVLLACLALACAISSPLDISRLEGSIRSLSVSILSSPSDAAKRGGETSEARARASWRSLWACLLLGSLRELKKEEVLLMLDIVQCHRSHSSLQLSALLCIGFGAQGSKESKQCLKEEGVGRALFVALGRFCGLPAGERVIEGCLFALGSLAEAGCLHLYPQPLVLDLCQANQLFPSSPDIAEHTALLLSLLGDHQGEQLGKSGLAGPAPCPSLLPPSRGPLTAEYPSPRGGVVSTSRVDRSLSAECVSLYFQLQGWVGLFACSPSLSKDLLTSLKVLDVLGEGARSSQGGREGWFQAHANKVESDEANAPHTLSQEEQHISPRVGGMLGMGMGGAPSVSGSIMGVPYMSVLPHLPSSGSNAGPLPPPGRPSPPDFLQQFPSPPALPFTQHSLPGMPSSGPPPPVPGAFAPPSSIPELAPPSQRDRERL